MHSLSVALMGIVLGSVFNDAFSMIKKASLPSNRIRIQRPIQNQWRSINNPRHLVPVHSVHPKKPINNSSYCSLPKKCTWVERLKHFIFGQNTTNNIQYAFTLVENYTKGSEKNSTISDVLKNVNKSDLNTHKKYESFEWDSSTSTLISTLKNKTMLDMLVEYMLFKDTILTIMEKEYEIAEVEAFTTEKIITRMQETLPLIEAILKKGGTLSSLNQDVKNELLLARARLGVIHRLQLSVEQANTDRINFEALVDPTLSNIVSMPESLYKKQINEFSYEYAQEMAKNLPTQENKAQRDKQKYLKMLGLRGNPSWNEVKQKRNQLIKLYHPDLVQNKNSETAALKSREINTAFEDLKKLYQTQ